MVQTAALFSQTYAEARDKFVAAADAAGLTARSCVHPLPGRDGETLALDVVLDGADAAPNLLIMSSGCHGVEGFCGSAVQTMLLGDAGFRSACQAANVSVLHLHALNPWGFSWWRRTTHENVDLNRNFHDFDRPLPSNPRYDELADLLVPADWPPTAQTQSAMMQFINLHGMPALQAAVSSGQYRHADGLFYGGSGPSWSNLQLRALLRQHGAGRQRLGWIDVHSGLGPCGVGEKIFASGDDPQRLARTRRWWGDGVTSVNDGSSTSARLDGVMWQAVIKECPQAEYTGIALEFGTVPLLEVLDVLRADQWLQNHPQAEAKVAAQIKRQLRDAFYVDTDDWKTKVLMQAADTARQGVAGLAEV